MNSKGIERFVGFRFPDGKYTVDPELHEMYLKAVDAVPSPAGNAHPLFGFLAAHCGMGYTFPQFMELIEAPLDAGALFGQEDLQLHRPLRIGETVTVKASIVQARSTTGAQTGRFDLVTCGIELTDDSGAIVCTSLETYVVPRAQQ